MTYISYITENWVIIDKRQLRFRNKFLLLWIPLLHHTPLIFETYVYNPYLYKRCFTDLKKISLTIQIDFTIISLHHKCFTILQRNRQIKFVPNFRANEKIPLIWINHHKNIFWIFVGFWQGYLNLGHYKKVSEKK